MFRGLSVNPISVQVIVYIRLVDLPNKILLSRLLLISV